MPPMRRTTWLESARRARPSPRLEIWKFGGASLADAAAVRDAVALIRRTADRS